MSGIFEITVSESRGFVAGQPDLDHVAIIIGCSSLGSGLSPFFLSGQSAVANVGYGDGVDVLTQTIEQRQSSGLAPKFPAAMYSAPKTTPGGYGTIDQSGVAGTAQTAVHSATLPFGNYEAYLRITVGGFIGTAGIEFVDSLDAGRNVSRSRALGTATTYTIPNSGVQFDFSPATADLTALNTLINDAFDDYNEHVVLTAGGVHGGADSADVVSNITYPSATNTATRIARMNALRAAYELHRIKTAGGVHGSADATNGITVPACTDDSSCLLLALNFKTKVNAHMIDVTAAIHGAPDGSSTITAPDPVAGAFAVGDIVRVRTTAPAPIGADLDTAATALALSTADFSLIVIDMDMTAVLLAHVSSMLDTLEAVGKPCTALVRSRTRNFETSETEATWLAAVNAEFFGHDDDRIVVRAAYEFVTDAMTSRQYLKSDLAQASADVVRINRADFPDVPADRQMPNCTLVDSTGATIGHDEGPRGTVTGLSDDAQGNRQWTTQRMSDNARREAVYATVPWTLYPADGRIRNLPTRRIANAMKRTIVTAGTSALGGRLRYIPADPNIPGSVARLTAASRKAIHGVIFDQVSREFQDDIQNPNDGALDTGLIQVNPIVTVTGGNLLKIKVKAAPLVFGYLLDLDVDLAVQE